MPGVSWRTFTMWRITMNMVQGCSLHLSPANLHVNLLYPADRTAGPPPHSSEKNCCLLMPAVLLLQKEAQTFLWEISARGILLRAFVFAYTDRDRGCQQLLLFWASFVKGSVSPSWSGDYSTRNLQFITRVDQEICRSCNQTKSYFREM